MNGAKHEPTQTNTPQTATAPTSAKDKHGTRDSQVRHTRLAGRGGKSPKPPLGKRNAPRQRRQGECGRAIVGKTRRALQRQRRRAAPKSNGNSATKLGRASHPLLGAGVVVVEPLGNAIASPKRRAAAPTALLGQVGTSLARGIHRPFGRPAGAAMGGAPSGAGLQPSRVGRREAPPPKRLGRATRHASHLANEEKGTNHPPRTPTPTTIAFAPLQPLLQPPSCDMVAFATGPGVGSRL